MDDGTTQWHQRLHHMRSEDLSGGTAQTSGMRRLAAISGELTGSEKIWMGETHVDAGVSSANHHHGESESAIFVLSGEPVFVFLQDGVEKRIETHPGDYVYIPPFVPHREENPSTDDEAIVVLARSTQEAIVVNLASLSDGLAN